MSEARTDTGFAVEQRDHARRMDALGRLAGGIAHDFNNLLTSIRGLGALALEELGSDHPLRPDLEEILKAAQRATDMTGDLLAFSGRQRVEAAVVDLNALVQDATPRARARNPGIDVHVSSNRPDIFVAADPQKLSTAIDNLLDSAARASAGTPVRVATDAVRLGPNEIAALPAGDYAAIHVTDHGQLTPDELDAVFEPFAAPRSLHKGTGLALAVAYGVVRRAGGLIIATAGHSGVTMTVFLPRVAPQTDSGSA